MLSAKTDKKVNFSSALWYILIVGGIMVLGFVAGLLSGSNAGYTGYTRSPLTPPDTVFAVVWPVLYFMMGNSFYFALNTSVPPEQAVIKTTALILFAVQLALNLAWPFFFFALGAPTLAFMIITLLDVCVLGVIVFDFMFNKLSAWLMIPYFLWICFATYLNIFIALYN